MHARVGILAEALFVEPVDAERGAARGEFVEEVGAQGFARAFVVPARAFGVGLAVFFLVRERGGLEGGAEFDFGDLVVVVEEFLGFGHGVAVVDFGAELVCVLGWGLVYVVVIRVMRNLPRPGPHPELEQQSFQASLRRGGQSDDT